MKRSDIIDTLTRKLDDLGVPPHVKGLAKIPSRVELQVLIDGRNQIFSCRRGITRAELDRVIMDLEVAWKSQIPSAQQLDIEEITGSPLAPA
jgi:hypothetical protein